ncbi:MAG: hypothetical protein LH481_04855 [Burkholderiales bacterium]|nr:hypothetical protein [Burkholderiales bacterium]
MPNILAAIGYLKLCLHQATSLMKKQLQEFNMLKLCIPFFCLSSSLVAAIEFVSIHGPSAKTASEQTAPSAISSGYQLPKSVLIDKVSRTYVFTEQTRTNIFKLDEKGRVTYLNDAAGNIITNEYEANGRLSAININDRVRVIFNDHGNNANSATLQSTNGSLLTYLRSNPDLKRDITFLCKRSGTSVSKSVSLKNSVTTVPASTAPADWWDPCDPGWPTNVCTLVANNVSECTQCCAGTFSCPGWQQECRNHCSQAFNSNNYGPCQCMSLAQYIDWLDQQGIPVVNV